jgi:hypothetical protein
VFDSRALGRAFVFNPLMYDGATYLPVAGKMMEFSLSASNP